MRVVALVIVGLAMCWRAASAQTPVGALTLEDVLRAAEARSESIGIARTAVTRADADVMRARSDTRPQLTATLGVDRALASEYEGVFDNLGGGDDGGGDAPPDEQGGLQDLPFGRENTWRFSLAFSQSLFDGGRSAAERARAAAGRQSANFGVTTARGQLLFDVTQAYYDAALADRLVAIAEATVTQATATLEQTEAGFQAGTQPEFDVLRARVSRDTLRTNVIRAGADREIALLRLKQLLDLPAGADLRLADSLEDERLAPPPTFAARLAAVEERPDSPAPNRVAVQDAATTVELQEAALRAVRADRLPSVSATSNYGRVAYPSNILLPTFNRLNWTVGFSAQVPILTGGRQRAAELTASANLEQARLLHLQVQELAELDTRSALAELVAARAAWDATAGTVQQARRAYELADIRYRAGVSTQLELSDARVLLQQADANRAQAARDLQVARARVALLPELPVAASTRGVAGAPTQAAPGNQSQQTAPSGGGQIRSAAVQGGTGQLGGGQ